MKHGACDDVWAITCYFNPVGYRSRLGNYRVFRRHFGALLPLVTVELACDAAFQLDREDAEIMIQLRGGDELWQKERLLNIALAALPRACRTVAWLDCNVVYQLAASGPPQPTGRWMNSRWSTFSARRIISDAMPARTGQARRRRPVDTTRWPSA